MDQGASEGRLAGKVAIVTGGGAGIGRHEALTRAIAWELGRFGVLSLAIRPRAFDGDLPASDKHASFVAFEEDTGLPMVGVHPFRHAVEPRGREPLGRFCRCTPLRRG